MSREIVLLCARGDLPGLRRRLAHEPDLAADGIEVDSPSFDAERRIC